MTEADEIAHGLIARCGVPASKAMDWGSAREWILDVWPYARLWVGDQMLSNIAESVAAIMKRRDAARQ